MTPIEAIETEMLARLKEKLPRTISRIDSFPDDPDAYDFPERESAAVFLRFDGSDYAGTSGSPGAAYAPSRTMTFEAVLLVRSLRGADGGRIGAYDALEAIRLALQGQSFAGGTAMVPRGEKLHEQRGGVWRWAMRFSTQIPAVAAITEHAPALGRYAEDTR